MTELQFRNIPHVSQQVILFDCHPSTLHSSQTNWCSVKMGIPLAARVFSHWGSIIRWASELSPSD
jgi:hypothetical protein